MMPPAVKPGSRGSSAATTFGRLATSASTSSVEATSGPTPGCVNRRAGAVKVAGSALSTATTYSSSVASGRPVRYERWMMRLV